MSRIAKVTEEQAEGKVAKMMGITGEEISAAMETAAAMSAFNVYNHGANPVSDFKAE